MEKITISGRQRAVIPTWHLKVGWEPILNILYIVNNTQEYKIDRILKISTTRFLFGFQCHSQPQITRPF